MKFACGYLLFLFSFFSYKKIIWWSDNPMFISPHCVIFSFVFINMWSIRVDVLGVKGQKVYKILNIFLLQMMLYLRLLLYSYFLLIILNHSDISLYSDPLVYAILRLTYWASLNCLIVFLETLFGREVYKQFQL